MNGFYILKFVENVKIVCIVERLKFRVVYHVEYVIINYVVSMLGVMYVNETCHHLSHY